MSIHISNIINDPQTMHFSYEMGGVFEKDTGNITNIQNGRQLDENEIKIHFDAFPSPIDIGNLLKAAFHYEADTQEIIFSEQGNSIIQTFIFPINNWMK
ncbi:hypothetical protein BpHYR1_044032 [Brachionus plicatilis]|uniref:Uncharacterized protein n=1 Tax=Brachionus plicatilis TaxID=10195 RepID=A0A3M7RT69_BRAPC|nr:hypothetical protein BpHYR1_044032 [Brachionus plicatilis]